MLTDTAFLDDAQSLGSIPCESLPSEPCWANMNTLSGGPLVAGLGTAPAPAASSSSDGGSSSSVSNSPTGTLLSGSASGATAANGNGDVAPGPPGVQGGVAGIKKRRKSDSKPLSQINKCLNEKRRREQENVYIEELAELISASSADMSSLSVKPDKCAILQETVNQIRRIREQEEGDGVVVTETNAIETALVPADGGPMGSSRPALLDTQVLGTFLLEALDGFLFVVNTEGKTEYVSDNVTHFLRYRPQELLGKSIYNIIHHGDHARFSLTLLPSAIGWPGDIGMPPNRSRSFTCRLLVQPPSEQEETMEEKQQRVEHYESMQITAVLQPYDPAQKNGAREAAAAAASGLIDSDSLLPAATAAPLGSESHCLVCVARRVPSSEKPVTCGPLVEQFSTKLDPHGKILAVDASGTSLPCVTHAKELANSNIRDLCHPDDTTLLALHLSETLQNGASMSQRYRLRLSGDYVRVHTKSRRFERKDTQETDFIMCTHSIIVEEDEETTKRPTDGAIDTPAMTSPAVGEGYVGLGGADLLHDFVVPDLFLPSSPWDLMNNGALGEDSGGPPGGVTLGSAQLTSPGAEKQQAALVGWGSPPATGCQRPGSTCSAQMPPALISSRPSSRQSASSTPRPPSVSPAFSPAPSSVLGVVQPSPALSPVAPLGLSSLLNSAPPPQQPSPTPFSSNFPFSPLQDNGLLASHTTPSTPLDDFDKQPSESGRLRILLMQGSAPATDEKKKEEARGGNMILKGLLNADDGDEEVRFPPRGGATFEPKSASSSASSSNNMLHKLLNVRSDDDEERVGLRKPHELLKKLLKDSDDDQQQQQQQTTNQPLTGCAAVAAASPFVTGGPTGGEQAFQEDQLLKSLGFSPSAVQSPASFLKSPQGLDAMAELNRAPLAPPALSNMSGGTMRGVKRHSDEPRANEDVKPSKEPMLDQLMANPPGGAGGAAGGGGVLHKLLGPTAAPLAASQSPNLLSPTATGGAGGGSKLCEKNKMLASLLAKTPMQSSLSTSIASPKPSALPQEKLPKDLKEKILQPAATSGSSGSHWAGGSVQAQTQQVQQQQTRVPPPPTQQQQQQQRSQFNLQQQQQQQANKQQSGGGFLNLLLNRPIETGESFLNSPVQPTPPVGLLRNHKQQTMCSPGGGFSVPGEQQQRRPLGMDCADGSGGSAFGLPPDFMASLDSAVAGWPDGPSIDPELSDIIEQVIDMNERYESDTMIFGSTELSVATPPVSLAPPPVQPAPSIATPARPVPVDKEKLAITAIQNSLMSFEKISPTGAPFNAPGASANNNSFSQALLSPRMNASFGPNVTLPGGKKPKMMPQQPQQQQQQQQQRRPMSSQNTQQPMLGGLLNGNQQTTPTPNQLSPGAIQLMDEFLNAIPPNMTISRADSQPTGSYGPLMLNNSMSGGQMASSQMSPGQRMQQPFSPHGHLAVNTSFSQPNQMGSNNAAVRLNQPQSYQMGQQQQQNSQLSPQPAIGARSSPGMQPNQPMGVVNWSNVPARAPQQQQHMMNFPPNGRPPYAPPTRGPMRSNQPAAPPSRPYNGMDGVMMGQAPANGMFVRQQSQQQPQPQQQQMRVQRTVSAPSGQVPVKPQGGSYAPSQYGYPGALGNGNGGGVRAPVYSARVLAFQPGDEPAFAANSQPDYQRGFNPHPAGSTGCYGPGDVQQQGAIAGVLTVGQNGPPGGAGGTASEYVRKELKAVVGARTQRTGIGGPVINLNQTLGASLMQSRGSSPVITPGGKPLNQADLEALGLSYELPPGSESLQSRQWDSPGMSESPSQQLQTQRNPMEEAPRPADPQMSLLKQLLSE